MRLSSLKIETVAHSRARYRGNIAAVSPGLPHFKAGGRIACMEGVTKGSMTLKFTLIIALAKSHCAIGENSSSGKWRNI